MFCACTPIPNRPYQTASDTQTLKSMNNLWDQIAQGFSLPSETSDNPAVRNQINWYITHPILFEAMVNNAKPYLYYVYQQVQARHLPGELTLLPLVESGYNPTACSPAGAIGMWQMMPETALSYGLKINRWYEGPKDIVASTNAALDHLVYLNKIFNHDWLLTIAAYDGGEGKVQKMIEKNQRKNQPTDFWHLDLPVETKDYVSKLLAIAVIIRHPNIYHLHVPSIPATSYFKEVTVHSQIDLESAAKIAHMKLKDISTLNPEFRQLVTTPQHNTTLLLPTDKADQFNKALKNTPKTSLVNIKNTSIKIKNQLIIYKIQHNDSLPMIAEDYNVSIYNIMRWNHLKDPHQIHAGQKIIIYQEKQDVIIFHSHR